MRFEVRGVRLSQSSRIPHTSHRAPALP